MAEYDPFVDAERRKLRLRIALAGASGAGKTMGALRLAYGLAGDWSQIFVIDGDDGMALSYAGDARWGIGTFKHMRMDPPHSPDKYLATLQAAERRGAKVVVIDPFSHFWSGRGGVLDMHREQKGSNDFVNWGKVNPSYNKVMDYLVYDAPFHVVVTLREKMKHVLEQEETEGGKTKSVPKRIGLEPIARPNSEYEFMLYLSISRDSHMAEVITQRGSMFPDGATSVEVTEALGQSLGAWADSGIEETLTPQQVWDRARLKHAFKTDEVAGALGVAKVSDWMKGHPDQIIEDAISLVVKYKAAKPPAPAAPREAHGLNGAA